MPTDTGTTKLAKSTLGRVLEVASEEHQGTNGELVPQLNLDPGLEIY